MITEMDPVLSTTTQCSLRCATWPYCHFRPSLRKVPSGPPTPCTPLKMVVSPLPIVTLHPAPSPFLSPHLFHFPPLSCSPLDPFLCLFLLFLPAVR